MAGFADTINQTENIPDAPDESRYDGPPRMRWANGAKASHPSVLDVPGTFYISEKTLGGLVPAEPWNEVSRYEDETGYEAEELNLIIIASKSQPFADKRNDKGKWIAREWQASWEPGVSQSVQTEYLCIAEGFYDQADPLSAIPLVLAVKGMVGRRMKELLEAYRKDLLAEASRIASIGRKDRVRLPQWSFRIPFGPERDKKGKYAFTDTGFGSTVQLPVLRFPPEINEAVMTQAYVGDAMLQHGRFLYDSYELWRTARYTNKTEGDEDQAERPEPRPASGQLPAEPTFKPTGMPSPNGMTLEEEFAAIDETQLARQRLGFGRRRETALQKLDWDTDMREYQEAQIVGHPVSSFKALDGREQFLIVRQLERFATGQESPDIPF